MSQLTICQSLFGYNHLFQVNAQAFGILPLKVVDGRVYSVVMAKRSGPRHLPAGS